MSRRSRMALRRFVGLPRSVFGTAIAHLGLGLTLLGIVGVLSSKRKRSAS
jgi:cytochrome c-type biogenesis protein CcmF